MKKLGSPLLSISAPLLIMVAFVGFLQREGSDRLQTLPALVAGIGLIISGAMARRKRRKKLLREINRCNEIDN